MLLATLHHHEMANHEMHSHEEILRSPGLERMQQVLNRQGLCALIHLQSTCEVLPSFEVAMRWYPQRFNALERACNDNCFAVRHDLHFKFGELAEHETKQCKPSVQTSPGG